MNSIFDKPQEAAERTRQWATGVKIGDDLFPYTEKMSKEDCEAEKDYWDLLKRKRAYAREFRKKKLSTGFA